MEKKSKIRRVCTILVGMVCVAVCLTSCGDSSKGSEGDGSSLFDKPEVASDTISSSAENSVVLDTPEDFLEFQNYIGKDISIFGMEAGLEEYDGGESSLYGHSGTVEIGVGWDGKTIIRAVLTFDNKDNLIDDFDDVSGKLEEVFGDPELYDSGGITSYSGKTDFDFNLSRRYGTAAISWNGDNRKVYDSGNPNASEQNPPASHTPDDPYIGMTSEQVLESTWGEPTEINKRTTQYGVSEQWVYRTDSKTKYIYLDDGVVTAIQE